MPDHLAELIHDQHGVVSRQQLLDAGLGHGWVQHRVRCGQWRTLHPGVFVTYTGPVDFRGRTWAALLHAGPGAVASHRTAAHLQGLLDTEPDVLEVSTRGEHRTTKRPGLIVRRRLHLNAMRQRGGSVPQSSVEDTVLDLVEASAGVDAVVGWLTRACQRRLTTPARIAAAAARRSRLRHRRLLSQVLDDVRQGVASALERRYARDVERAHGLPRGMRNSLHVVAGVNRYSDVCYRRWLTRVELESVAYHPADGSHRDQARDNAATVTGEATLRYGWRAVAGFACSTANEVASVLRAKGWPGQPVPCGPGCAVASSVSTSRQLRVAGDA